MVVLLHDVWSIHRDYIVIMISAQAQFKMDLHGSLWVDVFVAQIQ